MSEIVSVRIRKETKETLERSGVDVSAAVRGYLEELSWEVKSKERLKELNRLIDQNVKPVKRGFAARAIREDRDNGH